MKHDDRNNTRSSSSSSSSSGIELERIHIDNDCDAILQEAMEFTEGTIYIFGKRYIGTIGNKAKQPSIIEHEDQQE